MAALESISILLYLWFVCTTLKPTVQSTCGVTVDPETDKLQTSFETSVNLKKQYCVWRRAVSRYFNIQPLKLINIISKLFPTIPQSKPACQTFGDEMFLLPDNLSDALEKLKIASTDSATDSVESCLDCLLKALANNSEYRRVTSVCICQHASFGPRFPTATQKHVNKYQSSCLDCLTRPLFLVFCTSSQSDHFSKVG